MGPRRCIADKLLARVDVMRAMHERVQLFQDPQTEFALLRESLGVSRMNHILRVNGHEILHEERAAQIFDEVGDRSLERLFPGFTEHSREQATLSESQSRIGYKRARAHLGALIAANPLIRHMIRSAATGGLVAQPLLDRLDCLIQTASADFVCTPDNSETATAQLYLQKAAQAAEEARQQVIQRLNGPAIVPPTIADVEQGTLTSQRDDDDSDPTFAPSRRQRLNAPQLQAQLSRLSDRTRLRHLKNNLQAKGAWQQMTRIVDLCHAQVSHKCLFHLDACGGSVLANVQKRLGNRSYVGFGDCHLCGAFLDAQLEHGETCSTTEATRGHCRPSNHHRTKRTHRNTIQAS